MVNQDQGISSTKYILSGGFAQQVNSENDSFFKEILKDTKDELTVLLVEFAHDPARYSINADIDKSQFVRVQGDKKFTFDIADTKSFEEQIKNVDIVYIGGGTTVRLMSVLKDFTNLKELFSGKVVAGESAGANALSTYCYSKSGGGVIKGMGLVPVKIIPHYNGEHQEELEKVPEKLETLLLSNYQYKVFTISTNK